MSMLMKINALSADVTRLREQDAAGTLTQAHRDQILTRIETKIAEIRRSPIKAPPGFRAGHGRR